MDKLAQLDAKKLFFPQILPFAPSRLQIILAFVPFHIIQNEAKKMHLHKCLYFFFTPWLTISMKNSYLVTPTTPNSLVTFLHMKDAIL